MPHSRYWIIQFTYAGVGNCVIYLKTDIAYISSFPPISPPKSPNSGARPGRQGRIVDKEEEDFIHRILGLWVVLWPIIHSFVRFSSLVTLSAFPSLEFWGTLKILVPPILGVRGRFNHLCVHGSLSRGLGNIWECLIHHEGLVHSSSQASTAIFLTFNQVIMILRTTWKKNDKSLKYGLWAGKPRPYCFLILGNWRINKNWVSGNTTRNIFNLCKSLRN